MLFVARVMPLLGMGKRGEKEAQVVRKHDDSIV